MLWLMLAVFFIPVCARAERGAFDIERWYGLIDSIKEKAISQGVSQDTINQTVRYVGFIPSIVKSDKNQSEFKLTDAFFTLMYDGRRESFFTNQLMALMKIADKNKLDINDIRGSWAGAMGHFQFIPTTLSQYGIDGNNDGRVDIINSVGDAMFSAANYLNKLGWNPNEKIVRRVILPADFDLSMLDGKTKLTLPQWAALGVVNPDGSPIPSNQMTAGLVADVAYVQSLRDTALVAQSEQENINMDTDIAPMPVIDAYLTYPNFYRIKKWNNSNWYAIAIANLADKLK